MKYKLTCIGVALFFVLIIPVGAQENAFPVLQGPYRGQKPPEIFKPDIIAGNAKYQNKSDELDKLFTCYHDNGMFNGIVLAAENGNVIYKKAFGFSDFENKSRWKHRASCP